MMIDAENSNNPKQDDSQDRVQAQNPQKVEVVVQGPPSQGEINITAELAIFLLRVLVSVLMIHHGLEKFHDPEGFAQFLRNCDLDVLPLLGQA